MCKRTAYCVASLMFLWLTGTLVAGGDRPRRIVVLGIDGMDHNITRSLMSAGAMPNCATLARSGCFVPMEPSNPPLSPVAWSNFVTGMNPGGHGVFDFLRRDPSRAGSRLVAEDAIAAIVRSTDSHSFRLPFTNYVWPTQSKLVLLRQGSTLWEVLEAAGVHSTIYKMPASFPVTTGRSDVLAGMGTPDIEGNFGTFTYITDSPDDWGKKVDGGRVIKVKARDGIASPTDGTALKLRGPLNPFRSPALPDVQRYAETAFDVYIDPTQNTACVRFQDTALVLREGEWSAWQSVQFDLLPNVRSIAGHVRFYLQEAGAHLRLYVSPVNLTPGTDGLASGGFDEYLQSALGPYFTKGMSEETKAVTQGLFSTDDYLRQSNLVFEEGLTALGLLMRERREGLLFFYVSTLDLNCHVLWRHSDPSHPAYDKAEAARHVERIPELYRRVDKLIGTVREQLQTGDRLYVISDHGFAPFYREFNLPGWLVREGYLFFKNDASRNASLSDIDWSRTKAYSLGFQSLYVNLRGREGDGIVEPGQRGKLLDEVASKLLAFRDQGASPPLRGQFVFRSALRAEDVYCGDALPAAPDLILGYHRGYGPSDDAVLGISSSQILGDHLLGFSGHHTCDPSLVEGVFFSTSRFAARKARLEDVTVSILRDFGVAPAERMSGHPME